MVRWNECLRMLSDAGLSSGGPAPRNQVPMLASHAQQFLGRATGAKAVLALSILHVIAFPPVLLRLRLGGSKVR